MGTSYGEHSHYFQQYVAVFASCRGVDLDDLVRILRMEAEEPAPMEPMEADQAEADQFAKWEADFIGDTERARWEANYIKGQEILRMEAGAN